MCSRISLLEKFGTCTVIMPYFGHTHRSFLLLSQLNKGSREMLNEFYEGILNWLIETTIWLRLNYDDQKKILFLPWNLFRFDLILNSKVKIESFILLIESIHNKKGYYFNEHFMHSRLCLERLHIESSLLELSDTTFELFQKTKIINVMEISKLIYVYIKCYFFIVSCPLN